MNHYPHHIGDFNNATRHLTRVERSLYRDLLELYYDTEQPLNVDVAKIARRVLATTEVEREALNVVLDEFFSLQADGWHNARCDEEIAKYQGQIEQASRAGKASAAKRYNKILTAVEQPFNQPEPEPEPILEPKGSVARPPKKPTCPTSSIVNLYHEILPEMPVARLMPESRKKAIAKFWNFVLTSEKADGTRRATTHDEALTWTGDFFNRARDNDFLMGRGSKSAGHENWQCDIDFLMTDKGMKHVIEKTKETA
jgi:uncharacterized protein YdaU (DUF1376 family)